MKYNPKHSVLCESRILHDKRLSCTDVRVFLHLKFRYQYFASQNMEYFEGYQAIEEAIQVSVRAIGTSVAKLVSLGYVTLERRGRGTYKFHIL